MSTQPTTSAEKSSSENLNRLAGPHAVAAAAGVRQLNPRLDKMIAAYATAASAVGLALLAAAQPAEGKIVYTKTYVSIGRGDTDRYHLDLNRDGIGDFSIGFCSCEPEGTKAGRCARMRGFRTATMWAIASYVIGGTIWADLGF
ncbi:MAG: hypothetical protein ABSG34_09245 [Candidatus Sulfotelmatobacter sp.]|jgi:hypothetical protein